MKSRNTDFFVRLFASLLCASVAFAQQDAPAPPQPAFSQEELDQMLAPIALYPDSLLSQILMASTYPLEVVEAARWSKANSRLVGDQAVQAVAQNNWDPSVKSLVAFPQVLAMMEEKLQWMERVGDAFLSQQAQVMDTVQSLRHKAYAAGNLKSSDQYRVEQQGPEIIVEPPDPAVVYVPYYDPTVVYGPWWWPAYPPVFWPMWPGYYARPGFGIGFGWGVGITVGVGFFFGGFDWGHHHADVGRGHPFYGVGGGGPGAWHHDPDHRRGVPYRDAGLRQQFGRASQSPEARNAFRGHQPSPGGFGGRAASGTAGAPARAGAPEFNRAAAGQAPRASAVSNRPSAEPSAHAFEGVGHGSDVRNFSARGQSSVQRMAPSRRSAPASRPASPARGGGQRR